MNSLVLPPVALGPVTARRSVLSLPRDRRAMLRNFCKPLSTLLKHRHPQLIAPRRLLSSTSSSTFNHRVDKMPAKENAWVGYQGAAGFDLRSEFATTLYLYAPQRDIETHNLTQAIPRLRQRHLCWRPSPALRSWMMSYRRIRLPWTSKLTAPP